MFRVQCLMCHRLASATATGVICAHDGPSGTRCGGTGYRTDESQPESSSRVSSMPGVALDDTRRRTTSAPSERALEADATRREVLRADARARLRDDLSTRYKLPSEAWEQSGPSVRAVGGGLPGLGRRS